MPALPLDGFTVIDLTAHRAGPTAVRQLADWGANVIKIEQPGDATDATGSRRDGPDFQNLHRNKRSITINLKSTEGHELFMTMAKKADVIVENFKSTVKHRLGIDYEAVKKINPRIVYGSISGFGQDGPYEGRAGVDQIAQGMGGLMSITGHPGQGPTRVGIAINDTSSGILLANGITLALLARERTGEGQWVHTSLLEAQIFMLDFQASRYTMKGEVAKQEGNFHPTSPGTGMFQTADGYINIAASGDSLWKKFCEVAGDKDLSTKSFRQLLKEIGMLLCYEVTRDLPLTNVEIETPMARMASPKIAGDSPGITQPSLGWSTGRRMPRCLTCGSAKTWSIVLIGPHGTPALLSASIQNWLGFDFTTSVRWAISAGRFLERACWVAKSGLAERSLSPATSQNFFHRLSPEAAMLI